MCNSYIKQCYDKYTLINRAMHCSSPSMLLSIFFASLLLSIFGYFQFLSRLPRSLLPMPVSPLLPIPRLPFVCSFVFQYFLLPLVFSAFFPYFHFLFFMFELRRLPLSLTKKVLKAIALTFLGKLFFIFTISLPGSYLTLSFRFSPICTLHLRLELLLKLSASFCAVTTLFFIDFISYLIELYKLRFLFCVCIKIFIYFVIQVNINLV